MPRKAPLPPEPPKVAPIVERPKLSAFQLIVQSEGFKEVISLLESEHPRHKGLAAHATMEQRAAKQLGDQAYETILARMRTMSITGSYQHIKSTYEEIK